MKKNFLKNIIRAGFVGSLMLFSPFPQTEAGIVTDRFPIQMYVDHQLDTYTHAGDSRCAGWADANTDLIRVYSVSNGWARVSHPGRGGTVNRYCRVNELFADPNYSNRSARVKGAQSAYRTSSGNATIGSVSNNEEVIVLADNGRRAQIIYRLNNGTGYKIGWVPSSSVQGGASSGGASSKGNGDVDGDGQVTKSDVDMLLAYIQGKRGDLPRKDNADLNGDGSIDIFDVTAVNNILRNSAAQTRPSQSNVSTVNSQRVITNNTISVRTAGIANGWYKIHPAHDMGRALDALGAAMSNGNNLHMWSNANVPQQKFYLENRGSNWFTLRTGYGSGLYVTAVGSGNGANLEMKSWSGSSSQMFQLVNGGNVNGKTVYHIMAKVGSNLNFDCAGGGRSDGNNAQLWTKESGSSWHKWYFEPVSANSGNTTTNNRVNQTTSLVGKTVAAKRGVNAYRYSNLTTKIGSVYAGDSCKVVREGSNAYYVQYPISKRPFYKFGWVEKNIFDSQPQPITGGSNGGGSAYTRGEYIYPVEGYYKISTLFYYKGNPLDKKTHKHSTWWAISNGGHFNALDISCPNGTKVKAVAAGEVVKEFSNSPKNVIVIQHDNGMKSLYAHLSKKYVRAGRVSAGQEIGESGDVGSKGAYHLHLEFSNCSPWEYYRDKVPFKYCRTTKYAYEHLCEFEDKQRFGEAVAWIESHTNGFTEP